MNDTSWLQGMWSNPIALSIFIVGILALVVTFSILGKKGLLSVNVKGLSIGNGEVERTICRQQVEYSRAFIDNFLEKVGYSTENMYRARYISEICFDEIVSCICYNHITDDDFYWKNKAERIWACVIKYVGSPEYKTEEFKEKIFTETRKLITHLVEIRKYYSKENK